MTAAGLCAGAGAQLTCLRLAGNSELTELGSWLGPLPSLLRLEVSGCGLHSLEGLEAAAPLLQVGPLVAWLWKCSGAMCQGWR